MRFSSLLLSLNVIKPYCSFPFNMLIHCIGASFWSMIASTLFRASLPPWLFVLLCQEVLNLDSTDACTLWSLVHTACQLVKPHVGIRYRLVCLLSRVWLFGCQVFFLPFLSLEAKWRKKIHIVYPDQFGQRLGLVWYIFYFLILLLS